VLHRQLCQPTRAGSAQTVRSAGLAPFPNNSRYATSSLGWERPGSWRGEGVSPIEQMHRDKA
jgi:hypothetical protein